MREINLNRQLLGLEDLEFGIGTVEQTRAGTKVNITKINAGNLPFDETRTLVEFAQEVNIEELGNSVEAINNLNNDLDKLLIVEDNLPIINNVEAIKESIVTLDTNILALQNIDTNMSSINTVEDSLPEVVSVAQNIVPNLTEILNVDTLAAQVTQDKSAVSSMKLAVETIYDTFDDRFLGTKIVDPILDNDGNALIDGAMYFNTTSNTMKVYDVGTTTWYAIPQIYLSALLDVNLTSITSGNVLRWNGTKWSNYSLSKSDVGLNLVDNTSDLDKPVSTAVQTALDLKAPLDSASLVNPTINGIAQSGYSGFKNYLINGRFNVWKRGESFNIPALGYAYISDRWFILNNTDQEVNISKADMSPLGLEPIPRVRIAFTVAPTRGSVYVAQRMELMQELSTKTVTAQFLHSSIENISFNGYFTQYFGSGGSYTVVTTQPSDTSSGGLTVKKYVKTVTLPSVKDKIIGSGYYTEYTIALPIRSTNPFSIAQVQIEEGLVATPFENRPIGLELSLCQRYLPSVTGFLSGYAATTSEVYLSVPTDMMPLKVPTGISFTLGGTIYYSNNASAITSIVFFAGSFGQNHTLKVKPTGSPLTVGHGVMVSLPNILFTGCEL